MPSYASVNRLLPKGKKRFPHQPRLVMGQLNHSFLSFTAKHLQHLHFFLPPLYPQMRIMAAEIQEALYKMDVETLQRGLEKYLMQTISFYDAANESYYHGMIVGLCAMMINSFRITSNRESGNGRYDVQMLPLTKHFPGFLIEIKAEKDCSEEQLEALAQAALQQINDRSYSAEMQALGIKSIIKYGLAFSGKSARIAAEKQTIE